MLQERAMRGLPPVMSIELELTCVDIFQPSVVTGNAFQNKGPEFFGWPGPLEFCCRQVRLASRPGCGHTNHIGKENRSAAVSMVAARGS